MFEKILFAGWGDMDFNAHMRNTAFLDKSGDVRMMFFAEHGFPMDEFVKRRLGPVIMRDELEYFKEVHLLAPLRVTMLLAGLAPDGSRFLIRNEFWREDGKQAARVTSAGGWMDLAARKLTVPPDALLNAIRALPKTEDYKDLPTSLKHS